MHRNNQQTILRAEKQNRNSRAWKKLCYTIDKLAEEEAEVFDLQKELGLRYFFQISTLPASIAKLKKVKTLNLYGSRLVRIPPEIGEMHALEKFIPYTSYSLHWFPYEINNCINLKDSTISTRALYGNYKGTLYFPDLKNNPVEYQQSIINCSICKQPIEKTKVNQFWISLWIGSDVIPLLVNSCSNDCLAQLPKPPEGYIQSPHKGGIITKRPDSDKHNHMFGTKIEQKSFIRRLWDKYIR